MMKQPVKIMKHLETTCADAADPGFVTLVGQLWRRYPCLSCTSSPLSHSYDLTVIPT